MAAVVLAMAPAFAQTSFLGISLTQPFPGEIPACPLTQPLRFVDTVAIKSGGPCYYTEKTDDYMVYNSPDLGIGHTLHIQTYKGRPLIFNLAFAKARYTQAADIFSSKYGKPQRSGVDKLYTKAGDTFESHTALWEGHALRIDLREIGNDVRWGACTVLNVALANEREQTRKADAGVAAGKL